MFIANAFQMQTLIDKPTAIQPKKTEIPFIVGPEIGRVTVQSTAAAEIKIGASALASRKFLTIRNPDIAVAVRIGSSGITEKTGYLLDPQETITIPLDETTPVAVYGRSTGYEVSLEVIES